MLATARVVGDHQDRLPDGTALCVFELECFTCIGPVSSVTLSLLWLGDAAMGVTGSRCRQG